MFSIFLGDTYEPVGPPDMYSPTGQPMDHEPSMGQVPIVPPGTPPNEAWGMPHPAHFNGMPPTSHPYMHGRRSPNLPMSQPPMMPTHDTMAMMTGPPRMPHPGMPHPELTDNDQGYPDYSHPGPHNHVEVY